MLRIPPSGCWPGAFGVSRSMVRGLSTPIPWRVRLVLDIVVNIIVDVHDVIFSVIPRRRSSKGYKGCSLISHCPAYFFLREHRHIISDKLGILFYRDFLSSPHIVGHYNMHNSALRKGGPLITREISTFFVYVEKFRNNMRVSVCITNVSDCSFD